MPIVADNCIDAWKSFVESGGIEMEGRDADFGETLRRQLQPLARNLTQALMLSSTDDLVRALFQIVAPFASMFRDIVALFERAGANQGREQWEIRIEGDHLGLESFQRFRESWERIEALRDVPAIDFHGAWLLQQAGSDADLPSYFRYGSDRAVGIADVDAWLLACQAGDYRPYPPALDPDLLPVGFSDAAAILQAAVEQIRRLWQGSRQTLMNARAAPLEPDMADALDPGTVAQNETDYWLGTSILMLAAALRLDPPDREAFGRTLEEGYAAYGRRQIAISADRKLLEKILSLPVWRRRHELYAVWVATQIVGALPDHDIELHHEDGKIVFAFKSTVVATITTALPELRLFAERKSPLADPIGKGRSDNVQPDYSLWSGPDGAERCPLVVEVKHYKQAARGSFSDALVDYARAHPDAEVVLVNYGPATNLRDDVESSVAARCRQIGNFTPDDKARCDEFAALVRHQVGMPFRGAPGGSFAILVDISGSMQSVIARPAFAAWLDHPANADAGTVAFADVAIVEQCPPALALATALRLPKHHSTELMRPIAQLLETYDQVFVATDADGAAGLAGLGDRLISQDTLDEDFCLVLVAAKT
jgi:hypothetical protein